MTGGDHIVQYGRGSIGKAQHTGSGDIVTGGKSVAGPESRSAAFDNVLQAIDALRRHLDETERAEVDSAVRRLDSEGTVSELKEPLGKIAGIAALLGEVGVPVINAIKELLSCFSSS
ncbi:hypothetical protein [Nonomuraea sp. LPB2021202275-12-8]|uniref:hypothetical protein n=1 Tax=Nonomuraea sp. LPB2021202275-12-8 TaxID=3120159 RepID=UPI00300D696E